MGINVGTVEAALVLRSNFAKVLGEGAAEFGVFERAIERVASKAKDVGWTLTRNISVPIAGAAGAALKASIDFETAFSGVKKTVDGVVDRMGNVTDEGLRMEEGLRRMSREIPITAVELAGVAEAAGQLGIQTENILGFTRTMADLGIATELTSEQAARGLAKIATITQMNQTEFDRLGSVINELETRYNAGADDIVEYGVRIASTAKTAGLAEKDFLAFGSAAASVGIQAEAGGTALSKVFQSVFEAVKTGNSNLETFAQTAGMTAQEFTVAFGQDAATAILKFVEGLGKVHREGGNVFAVMKDVEFQDVRLKNAMLALAGAGDQLSKQLATARAEWEANTSLTREAEIRYRTTASLLQRLVNIWRDIAVTIGNSIQPALATAVKLFEMLAVPVKFLADAFSKLPGPIQFIVLGLVGAAAAVGPLILALTYLVSGLLNTATAMLTLRLMLVLASGNTQMLGGALGFVMTKLDPLSIKLLQSVGVTGSLSGAVRGLIGYLHSAAGAFVNWSGAMTLLRTAGTAALSGLSSWAMTLVRAFGLVLNVIGWPRLLAAGIAYLLLQIPGMKGLLSDVVQICLLWARVITEELIGALKTLGRWVGDATSSTGSFVKGLLSHLPGYEEAARGWNRLTKAVRDYKDALAKKVDDADIDDAQLHALVPAAPTPAAGPDPKWTRAPMTALQALAASLGYTGDMADLAAMELTVLTHAMDNAVLSADQLTKTQQGYIAAAIAAKVPNDKIVDVLVAQGMDATVAAAAVGILSDRLDAQGQAAEAAKAKTEQYRQKIRDLTDDLTGQSTLVQVAEMFAGVTAAQAAGVPVARMTADAQAAINKVMTEATAVYRARGLAVPMDIAIMRELTASLADQEKQTEELRKVFKPLAETQEAWAKSVESRLEARRDQLKADGEAWIENAKAIREAAAVTESYYAAATDNGLDTLQKRLDAVTREYAAQREAIPALERAQSNYHTRIVALTQQEAAARAKVTAEFIKTLPLTKEMEQATKRAEIASLEWCLKWAEALGLDEDAIARIQLRLQQLDRELKKSAWFDPFLQAAQAISGFQGLIEGVSASLGGMETVAGRVFAAIAVGIEQATKAAETFGKFAEAWAKGDIAGQIGAIGQSAGNLWASTGTNNSAANYAGGLTNGAATGAAIGTMILPGVGTIVGGVIGLVVGGVIAAIRNNAEWRKVMKDLGRDWGVAVSDELAKSIAEVSKKIGRLDAPLFFLREIFAEAGGIETFGLDNAIKKTRQLFESIGRGSLTAADAARELNEVFPELAEAATRSGHIASKAFLELIRLQRELGEEVQSVEEFLTRMTGVFSEGAIKRVKAFFDAFDLEKIAGIKKALAEEQPEAVMGVEETRLRQELAEAQNAVLDSLGGTREEVEKEFQRMGLYAGVAFAETLRREGFAKALEVAGPMFEQLLALQEELGLQLEGAAAKFAAFYAVARDNKDVMLALEGLTQMIVGAGNAGFLTQELMSAFAADAAAQFTRLTERGVDANTAMILMQPTLQALWEAQDRYGLAVDATTQALIDQAVEAGIVGEHQKDVNEQILDVLKAIAKVFGVDLPDATKKFKDAATEAATVAKNAFDKLPKEWNVDVNTNYTSTGTPPDFPGPSDADNAMTGGLVTAAGVLPFERGGRVPRYYDNGGLVGEVVRFIPKGTDTVPAMLTPGEIVLNAAQQQNVARDLQEAREDSAARALLEARGRSANTTSESTVVVLPVVRDADPDVDTIMDIVAEYLPEDCRTNRRGHIATRLKAALEVNAA